MIALFFIDWNLFLPRFNRDQKILFRRLFLENEFSTSIYFLYTHIRFSLRLYFGLYLKILFQRSSFDFFIQSFAYGSTKGRDIKIWKLKDRVRVRYWEMTRDDSWWWFLKEINPNPIYRGKFLIDNFTAWSNSVRSTTVSSPMGPTAGDPNTTRLYLLFHGYTSTLWERMKWPAKTATRYRTRCRRATTTEEASVEGCARRVLHAATVNGEATSFPRPIRIQGGCGWTQGRPMTRAQPWEFAAVGLQLEMFCTVLIFRPDDEMPGKHEKIVAAHGFPAGWKISSIRAETISPRFNFSRMRERWKMFTITIRFYLMKLIFSTKRIEIL